MAAGTTPEDAPRVRRQRVAAYAVIARDGQVLLSRLAPYLTAEERWTLPGGGIDFGEHPRDAVVREIYEETGLHASVGELAWVDSARRTTTPTVPELAEGPPTDMHSVRVVFEGWVPADSPEPHVVEVDGSTVDARWHPLSEVHAGRVPTVPMVQRALASMGIARRQRLAAYAVVRRGDEVLLTRNSPLGPYPGSWTLPGGGVEFGESPDEAVLREFREETGLELRLGELLGVDDVRFEGTAPSGRREDFHGVHLVFAGTVDDAGEPHVVERDGTTDEVAWVPVERVTSGALALHGPVERALAWLAGSESRR